MDVFALISFTVAAATLAYAASLDERLKKQTKRIEQLEKQLARFDQSFDSR